MSRRRLAVTLLFALFLLATAFFPTFSQQSGKYDPWLDYNGDGIIDVEDLQLLAQAYGTSGDPNRNVTITNFPMGRVVKEFQGVGVLDIQFMLVMNNRLYMMIGCSGEIWSFDGYAFRKEYQHLYWQGYPTPPDSGMRMTLWRAIQFSKDGKLYFAGWCANSTGAYRSCLLRSSGNGNWELLYVPYAKTSEIFGIGEYNQKLYFAVTHSEAPKETVFFSYDGTSFSSALHTISSQFVISGINQIGTSIYFVGNDGDIGVASPTGCMVKFDGTDWTDITTNFYEGLTSLARFKTMDNTLAMVGGAEGSIFVTPNLDTLSYLDKVGQLDGTVIDLIWETFEPYQYGKKILAITSNRFDRSSLWMMEDIFNFRRIFTSPYPSMIAGANYNGLFYWGKWTDSLSIDDYMSSRQPLVGAAPITRTALFYLPSEAFQESYNAPQMPFIMQRYKTNFENNEWIYADAINIVGRTKIGIRMKMHSGSAANMRIQIYGSYTDFELSSALFDSGDQIAVTDYACNYVLNSTSILCPRLVIQVFCSVSGWTWTENINSW